MSTDPHRNSLLATGVFCLAGFLAGPTNAEQKCGELDLSKPEACIILADGSQKRVSINPSKSGPVCGGEGQISCGYTSTEVVRKATDICPAGSFPDLASCWSCPGGYGRSIFRVDGDRACEKRVDSTLRSNFSAATYGGPLCPPGSFFDPIRDGECWKCPSGYQRSLAHIDAANACFVPAGEKFSRATRHKTTIWPHECSAGQFHDGWDGGGCWTCPSGYHRTAYHIADGNACVAGVAEQQAHAERVKQAACGPGEFYDMRIAGGKQDPSTGGGCWSCPPTMERTTSPVTSDNACSVAAGFEYEKAYVVGPHGCDEGEFRHEGFCRICPTGYTRTLSKVDGPKACYTIGILWYTAPFPEPGLFGADLPSAEKVLYDLTVTRPGLVRQALDAAAQSTATAKGISVDEALKEESAAFIGTPQKSAVAAGLVFVRLLAAVADPTEATPHELALVQEFKNYIVKRRTYIASDAIAQYEAWRKGVAYRRTQAGTPMFANSIGEMAPDFGTQALVGMLGTQAASVAAGMLPKIGDVASLTLSVTGMGFDHPSGVAQQAGRIALETAIGKAAERAVQLMAAGVPREVAKQAGTKVLAAGIGQLKGLGFTQAGNQAVNGVLTTVSAAGPQIIIGVGLAIVSTMVDIAIQTANVKPRLDIALATAQSPPDLPRLAQTEEGMAELLTYWSYAAAGDSVPQPTWMAAFVPRATLALGPALAAIPEAVCAPAQPTSVPIDSGFYYRLTSQWQGDAKSLDILNDGKNNNRPILSDSGNYSGQLWKTEPAGNGYYRLSTAWQGPDKSLDVINDGKNNQLILDKTGNYTGQMWKISPDNGGFYRLTTAWQGDCKALDVVNDGRSNNMTVLAGGANVSGQLWKLTKTSVPTK